jgi:hypothetical protein
VRREEGREDERGERREREEKGGEGSITCVPQDLRFPRDFSASRPFLLFLPLAPSPRKE